MNKKELQEKINKLKSAIIFIPGTEDYVILQQLIHYLEGQIKNYIPGFQFNPVYNGTTYLYDEKKANELLEWYIAQIETIQKKLTPAQMHNLCLQQIQAHNKTIKKLNTTETELNTKKAEISQWKQVFSNTLSQARQKMRITAKTTKDKFLDGIKALSTKRDLGPVELQKFLNGITKEIR
ncbi:MAG: hypothetical protein IJU89_02830 [Alphaproteobacteria bacterium]|nr:hypothetical protein [Alphaproteobacteria bacterium]